MFEVDQCGQNHGVYSWCTYLKELCHNIKLNYTLYFKKNYVIKVDTGSNGVCSSREYAVIEHAVLRFSIELSGCRLFLALGLPFIVDYKKKKKKENYHQ